MFSQSATVTGHTAAEQSRHYHSAGPNQHTEQYRGKTEREEKNGDRRTVVWDVVADEG